MLWPPPPTAACPCGASACAGTPWGLGTPLGTFRRRQTSRAVTALRDPRKTPLRRGRPLAALPATSNPPPPSKPVDPAAPFLQRGDSDEPLGHSRRSVSVRCMKAISKGGNVQTTAACSGPRATSSSGWDQKSAFGKQRQVMESHLGPPEGRCPFREGPTGQWTGRDHVALEHGQPLAVTWPIPSPNSELGFLAPRLP